MRGPLLFHSAFLALIFIATAHAGDAPRPRTVADEVAVLEKGRIRAKQNALARLAAQTDPGADKVLLSQFERYSAGKLPPSLWLDLLRDRAGRVSAFKGDVA